MIALSIMLVLVLSVGVANIAWWSMLVTKADELDEREAAISETEEIVTQRFLASAREEDEYISVHSDYAVTEADELKYNSDGAIFKAARKQIAKNIANDIVHTFEPLESVGFDGRRVYSYRFKIKQ